MDRANKQFWIAIGSAVAILVGVVGTVTFLNSRDPSALAAEGGNPTTGRPAGTECITTPYFFANGAPTGSNRFGPELTDPSLEAGVARFDLKLRSDPAFAAVWERVILNPDWVNTQPGWYEARATEFLGNEELWCEQVDAIYDAIDKMEVQDRTEAYETLLMVPRGDAVPAIRKTERPVPMEHVLVLRLKDGRTEFARYVCDLQPARPEIPGVPPVSVPVPPAPPLPPGVTIPPVAPPPPTHPPTTRGAPRPVGRSRTTRRPVALPENWRAVLANDDVLEFDAERAFVSYAPALDERRDRVDVAIVHLHTVRGGILRV